MSDRFDEMPKDVIFGLHAVNAFSLFDVMPAVRSHFDVQTIFHAHLSQIFDLFCFNLILFDLSGAKRVTLI